MEKYIYSTTVEAFPHDLPTCVQLFCVERYPGQCVTTSILESKNA